MSNQKTNKSEAVRYSQKGLSVLPWAYINGSKRPALRWKELQTRRLTDQEINNWWREHPAHNVGVVTGAISNLVVLDADDDDAIDWVMANIPETAWAVRTGRGMQFGYRHPGEGIVRNRAKINGMNLDLRGDGGYVAMPPSIHKTGARYEWALPIDDVPEPDSLPTFSASWLPQAPKPQFEVITGGKVDKSRAYMRASRWMAKRDPAIEGAGGDQHTYITACHLVRDFGLNPSEAMGLLLEWNQSCQPPWTQKDLEAKIRSALKSGQAPIGSKSSSQNREQGVDLSNWSDNFNNPEAEDLPENDYGNAQRFARKYKNVIRYCYDDSCWYVWNSKQWRADDSGAAMRLAKTIPASIQEEAREMEGDGRTARFKHAFRTGAANKLTAMLALSASEPGIPANTTDFDKEPLMLNTPSGCVDLTTGALLAHDPANMQSQITNTPYNPRATCPTWLRFLDEIFHGDQEMVRYMQQLAGYSISGAITEHIFIYCYGGGRNGKSTFINTLIKILGDYAGSAPPNLLIAKRNDPHPTELAFLKKLRMALGGEVKPGERLDEGKVKHLTGGEKITARTMRKDFSEFIPTHTLWLAGNSKLKIYATDLGMWERIKLIPFTAKFVGNQRDVHLPQRLLDEGPGILCWAVQGCIDWLNNGFNEPEIVTKATLQYKQDENLFQQWLTDRTEAEEGQDTPHKEMRQNYISWCEDNAIKNPYSTRAFTNAMRDAGFSRSPGGSRKWKGIRIKSLF
tara:strand:+ start:1511 stop:3730 length:2220 start_codon:yes stop_codon:yes gene_type:complete